ncbi:unnamed protein product [Notodromas monacha]|uniref:Uncharacterized protein n=1 Tax=Notodromas monacha TaxID=399045 RepID=A0A7R9GCB9_9CRUS|nr:unnamed protein product [Notodromas monacha]CAG0915929.1 unnamed protein product [Notodromas monacha]
MKYANPGTPSPRRLSHAKLGDSGKMDSLERKRLLKSLLGSSVTRVDGATSDRGGNNETDLEPEDFNMEELAHLGERLQILLRPRSPAETDVEVYFHDDSVESNDGPAAATGPQTHRRIKVTVPNAELDPKLERRVTFAKMTLPWLLSNTHIREATYGTSLASLEILHTETSIARLITGVSDVGQLYLSCPNAKWPSTKRAAIVPENRDESWIHLTMGGIDERIVYRKQPIRNHGSVCKEMTSSSSEFEGSGTEERVRKTESTGDAREDPAASKPGQSPSNPGLPLQTQQHRRHRKFRFGGGRNRTKGFFRRQGSVSEDRNADVSSSDNVSTLDVTTPRRRDKFFGKKSRFLSGNSSDSVQEDNGKNARPRADSNDSVLSLSIFRKKPFRRSSSSLASPMGSEADDSSAVPTPISTPGSPTGHIFCQNNSQGNSLQREGSSSSLTAKPPSPGSPRRESSSEESCDPKTVEVPVVTIQRVLSAGSLLVPHYSGHPSGGHIMLEYYEGDMSFPLSPIKEVPTPMISPCPTPRRLSTVSVRGRSPTPSRQNTLCDDDTESDSVIVKMPAASMKKGANHSDKSSESETAGDAGAAIPSIVVTSPSRSKPPPLVVSSPGLNSTAALSQDDPGSVKLYVPFDSAPRSRSQSLDFPHGTNFVVSEGSVRLESGAASHNRSSHTQESADIPCLMITPSTPPGTPRATLAKIAAGELETQSPVTPPVQNVGSSAAMKSPVAPGQEKRKNSVTFDLPPITIEVDTGGPSPPKIMITAESDDTDPCDGSVKCVRSEKRGTTLFLSPLPGGTPRTLSESNLSSSGYSSMASPSTSRNGSMKTICEPESPGIQKGARHIQAFVYRVSSLHKQPSPTRKTEEIPMIALQSKGTAVRITGSDEATTTDTDYGAEHDSAIDSSDNLEAKPPRISKEPFVLSREKISEESCGSDEDQETIESKGSTESYGVRHFMIPAIIIDAYSSEEIVSESESIRRSTQAINACAGCEVGSAENLSKHYCNSSRSESPLSENGQCFIYCPQFFNSSGKELLYTDSDGLYDCPSSEVAPSDSATSPNKIPAHRRLGKKREKVRKSQISAQAVGTKNHENAATTLDEKPAERQERSTGASSKRDKRDQPRRKSPKKRTRAAPVVDSSSSLESLRSSSSGTRMSEEAKHNSTQSRCRQRGNSRSPPLHTNSLERNNPGSATLVRTQPEVGRFENQPESDGEWASASRSTGDHCVQIIADASGEDSLDDEPSSLRVDFLKIPKKKHPRFRSVGHQIRFICRLQRSLRNLRKERGEEDSDNLFVGSSSLDSDKIPAPAVNVDQSQASADTATIIEEPQTSPTTKFPGIPFLKETAI